MVGQATVMGMDIAMVSRIGGLNGWDGLAKFRERAS